MSFLQQLEQHVKLAELNHPCKAQPENNMAIAKTKAQESFLKAAFIKKYKLMLAYQSKELFEQLGPGSEELFTSLAELEAQHENNGVANKDTYGYFITVNPKYDEDTDTTVLALQLQKAAEKVSRKKGIINYYYCIEQGSQTEEEMGKHPHLHMLVQRNNTVVSGEPGKLKAGLKNSFKKFGNQQLNIKVVRTGSEGSRIKYIMGAKSDPVKLKMVEIDTLWRTSIGL